MITRGLIYTILFSSAASGTRTGGKMFLFRWGVPFYGHSLLLRFTHVKENNPVCLPC